MENVCVFIWWNGMDHLTTGLHGMFDCSRKWLWSGLSQRTS